MILGLSTQIFTVLHVILSLAGIVAGLVVVSCLLGSKRSGGWAALFLATTVLTSVTGFLFPSPGFGASRVLGVISLAVLAVALLGLYRYRLAGAWRHIYAVGVIIALYLNCFVAVVQGFAKVPFLRAFAPSGSEPPFLVAQLVLLAIFILLGVMAVRRFHPQTQAPA